MSRTIDNRVVNMQFNNEQFEKAVAQSRQSIKLLEKDLKLAEGVDALKNLDRVVNSVDFSALTTGVQTLSDRFSTLGIIGMSAISSITNAIVSGLLNSVQKSIAAITNLGKTIYTKGFTRASNIEQANFSLQGILSTQTKIQDETGKWITDMDGVQVKIDKIGKAIDASVSGTAYGYDEAAKIASTLVASYGSTDKGIAKIEKALKTTVGLAGQTGQEFDTVSRTMIKVAASGRAMGDELMSMERWGLGASAMLAEYINSDKKLQREMNKSLETRTNKRKAQQRIDEADIRQLAAKSKISADMVMEVFGVFFENAQKANDTLPGITRNIGAALGRLGAAFIEPVIRNEGEYVKFLQVVRQKLVDFLNVLKEVKLPDAVTNAINGFLKQAGDALNKLDIKKSKDFFQSISNFFNAPWVKNIQSTAELVGDALLGLSNSMYNINSWWNEDTTTSEMAEFLGSDIELLKKYGKEIEKITGSEDLEKLVKYINNMNLKTEDGNALKWYFEDYAKAIDSAKEKLLTYDQARELVFKRMRDSGELDTKAKTYKEFIDSFTGTDKELLEITGIVTEKTSQVYSERRKMYDETVNSYKKYIGQIEEEIDDFSEYVNKQTTANDKLKAIFGYAYITELGESLKQVGQAFINVKDTISDVLHEVGSPLADFFDILTGKRGMTIGDATKLRKAINSISEGIRDFAVRIRVFTTSDNFKSFVKGVVSIFEILRKVLKAVIEIAINAFHSFEPLFDRIFRLIGSIGEALGIIDESTDEFDVFGKVVETVSGIIDFLAGVLIKVWDGLMDLLSIFAVKDLNKYIEKFYNFMKAIAGYVSENWPRWLEKVNPYLEKFAGYAKKAGEWIKDKLGKALEFVKPYFDDFNEWVKDITDGLIDLEVPIDKISGFFDKLGNKINEFNPEGKAATDVINDLGEAIGGLGAGGGAFSESAPAKLLNGITKGFLLSSSEEKQGELQWATGELKEIEDDLVNPFTVLWEKIKKLPQIWPQIWEKFTWKANDKKNQAWEDIKENFEKFKKWLDGVNWDDLIDKFGKIFGIFTGNYIGLNVGKGISNVTSAIKGLPDVMKNVSETVRSFSPFAAEIAKADNWTTRLNAIKGGLWAIAAIIGAFALSIGAIVGSIYLLGTMDADSMWRGLGAFALMCIPLVVLMGVIIAMIRLMTGDGADSKTVSTTGVKNVKGLKGLKDVITNFAHGNFDTGTLSKTATGQNTWKNLAAVAGIIFSFGTAVLMIAGAIKILSGINEDALDRGVWTFLKIAGVMAIMLILVGAIAILLGGSSSSSSMSKIIERSEAGKGVIGQIFKPSMLKEGTKSASRGAGDWKVLAAMAGVIFVIGHAITEIMAAMAIVANLPMKHLDKAIDVFSRIALSLGLLIVIVGAIAVVVSVTSDKSKGKVIVAALLSMAAVIFVIGHSITEIMTALSVLANLPMNQIDKALTIFDDVSQTLIELVAIIGLLAFIIGIVSGSEIGGKGKVIVGAMLSMAAVIVIFTFALSSILTSIGEMAILMSILPEGMIEKSLSVAEKVMKMLGIIGLLAGVIAVVTGLIGPEKGTMMVAAMAALALVFASIALVMVAIGKMVKDIAASGLPIESVVTVLETIQTIIIVLAVVVGVIGILTAIVPEVMIPVLGALVGIFAALAAVFASVGVMSALVGVGVYLIADAITMLIDTFSKLDSKTLKKISTNITKFVVGMAQALIDGFISFATLVKQRENLILTSLVVLISIVIRAAMSGLLASMDAVLDTLGTVLAMIAQWFNDHTEDILTILRSIGQIIFTCLTDIFDFLLVLLFGEDANSGWIGTIIKFTFNMLDLLVNGGGEYEGLIPFLSHMAQQLATKAVEEFVWICNFIKDSPEIISSAFAAVDGVIQNFNNALIEYGPDLIDHVGELIETVVQLICYALGIGSKPSSSNYDTGGVEKGQPSSWMETLVKTMIPGFYLTTEFKDKAWAFFNDLSKYLRDIIIGKIALTVPFASLGVKIASKIFEGFESQKGANINSPSKRAMKDAAYVVEGFTKELNSKDTSESMAKSGIRLASAYFSGVENGFDNPTFSASYITDTIKARLQTAGQAIAAEVQGLFDNVNLEIVPGLDLTKIKEGLGDVQDLFNGSTSLSLDSISADNVSDIASKFEFANGISDPNEAAPTEQSSEPSPVVTFIQNNYSPEELNRIDIYRDTKNLLSGNIDLANDFRF